MSSTTLDLTAASLPAGVTLPAGGVHTQGVGVTIPANTVLSISHPNMSNGGQYDIEVVVVEMGVTNNFNIKTHINDSVSYSYSFKHGVYGNGIVYQVGTNSVNISSGSVNWNSTLAPENTLHFTTSISGGTVSYANGSQVSTGQAVSYIPATDPTLITMGSSEEYIVKSLVIKSLVDTLSTTEYTFGDTITMTGGVFALDQGLDLTTNGITYDVTGDITTQDAGSISFTLDSVNISYDTDLYYVIDDGAGNSGGNVVTVTPIATVDFVKALNPIVDATSILDGMTGDAVVDGFQFEWVKLAGLNINSDGTFEYSGTPDTPSTSFRVFSIVDNSWSASQTLSLTVSAPSNTDVLGQFTNSNLTSGGITCTTTPAVGTGNIYAIATRVNRKPTAAQLKLGKTFEGSDAEWTGTFAVSSLADINVVIAALSQGDYTCYAVHESSADVFTNIIDSRFSVLGALIPPVISQQPVTGTIQESIDTDTHSLTVSATPLTSISWEHNKAGGGWVTIPDEVATTLSIDGGQYTVADTPLLIRGVLVGGGGAVTNTVEVGVTVVARPYINLNIPNLPDGDYSVYLYTETTKAPVYNGLVTFVGGIANNIVSTANTGDTVVGLVTSDTLINGKVAVPRVTVI